MSADVHTHGVAEPLLQVEGLTKRFGGLVAVSDLTFEVRRGEILGLIGPNGAGKTTAFNLITGFDKPTRGRVRFDGRDITSASVHQRARAGMVRTFQGHDVFPGETARRNVEIALNAIPGRIPLSARLNPSQVRRQRENVRQCVDELLNRVGISAFADRLGADLPHALSGLLGVAMAMATEPRLILLDEPLAGVNQTDANEILEVIQGLRADGTTVVLVEHNMRAVMAHCERIVVIHHGQKLAEGAPDAIRNHPDVVKAYLGEESGQDVA